MTGSVDTPRSQAGRALQRRDLLGAAALLPVPTLAEVPWPSRPIRLVAPFATGGGPDILARLFAQELGAMLGASVVVENRAGMGGASAPIRWRRRHPMATRCC